MLKCIILFIFYNIILVAIEYCVDFNVRLAKSFSRVLVYVRTIKNSYHSIVKTNSNKCTN